MKGVRTAVRRIRGCPPAITHLASPLAVKRRESGAPRRRRCALTVPPFFWDLWQFVRPALSSSHWASSPPGGTWVAGDCCRRLSRLEQETSLRRERSRIAQGPSRRYRRHLALHCPLERIGAEGFQQPGSGKRSLDQIFRSAQAMVRFLDEIVWTVNPKNDAMDVFVSLSLHLFSGLSALGRHSLPPGCPPSMFRRCSCRPKWGHYI